MNYLQEVSSHKQLKQAWRHVRRKRNVTPGIDGESVKDFNSKIRTNLIKISTDLKKNKYQFSKVEEIKIPKHSNTAIQAFRAIRIYSIRDKIVQRSIQISLERIGKTSLFPELKKHEDEWLGFRPTLPDFLPVIGPSKNNKNLFYSFGHHHLGWTLGAISGKIISGMIAGENTNLNLTPYSSLRFS